MPTLLNWKGHRFFFYSKEIGEPPHVHILRGRSQMKVWLGSLEVARNVGFKAHEVSAIVATVEKHRDKFLEAWNAYFGD